MLNGVNKNTKDFLWLKEAFKNPPFELVCFQKKSEDGIVNTVASALLVS